VFAHASSSGGDTQQFAMRAGSDVVWQPRCWFGMQAGADVEAGWRDGFSMVLARAGFAIRLGRQRLLAGAGVPLGGDEPTTAIVMLGLGRDL
jgi:hypothetical protein